MRESGVLELALETRRPDADELAWDHAMDISGSIFARMEEIGISQRELAERAGMDPAQLSRVINGRNNMTLKTLAKIEKALGFRLDGGFRYLPTAGAVSVRTRGQTDWRDKVLMFKAAARTTVALEA